MVRLLGSDDSDCWILNTAFIVDDFSFVESLTVCLLDRTPWNELNIELCMRSLQRVKTLTFDLTLGTKYVYSISVGSEGSWNVSDRVWGVPPRKIIETSEIVFWYLVNNVDKFHAAQVAWRFDICRIYWDMSDGPQTCMNDKSPLRTPTQNSW